MIDDEERERIYECAVMDARAGMNADLRRVVDFVTSELRSLRIEVCRAAGLPPPPPLGNGHGNEGNLQ